LLRSRALVEWKHEPFAHSGFCRGRPVADRRRARRVHHRRLRLFPANNYWNTLVDTTRCTLYELAAFSFTDASNGTFAYSVNGISQTKAITREVFVPGVVTVCN
jgi:hypothetical protein